MFDIGFLRGVVLYRFKKLLIGPRTSFTKSFCPEENIDNRKLNQNAILIRGAAGIIFSYKGMASLVAGSQIGLTRQPGWTDPAGQTKVLRNERQDV